MSSMKDALRGATRVKMAVLDEARADKDSNRSVVVTPTMTVVDDPKMVVTSTAADADGIFLRERRDAAREAVTDLSSTVCLLEYSVDVEDIDDPADVVLWKSVLPAIGYSIPNTQPIKRAFDSMEEHTFCMEYLTTFLDGSIDEAVPKDIWRGIQSKKMTPQGDLVLAIDSPPEQDRTAAVVCDAYGQIGMAGIRSGPKIAYDWVTEILSRNDDIISVSMAANNTLKRVGERLRMDGVLVKLYDTNGMHMAASRFWEAAHAEPRQVSMRQDPMFDEANRGALRWALGGGGWVFKRQTPENFCSPLIAATLAYDAAIKPGELPPGDESDEDLWKKYGKADNDSDEWNV